MKTSGIISVILVIIAMAAFHHPAFPQGRANGTLLIYITGLKDTHGQLLVALYHITDEFLGETPAFGWGMFISKKEELIRFDRVPYGKYAIAVIHDTDNDGQLSKNFIGIPTEGYGFSNNAKGNCGPPSFRDASFDFSDNYDTKVIALCY